MQSVQVPLIVDLDGTLTPTDTLIESIVAIVKRNPLEIFRLLYWLLSNRCIATFKHRVAVSGGGVVPQVPFRPDFLAWLESEKRGGRTIILATAAHESIARSVAAHSTVFDAVLSTTAGVNLKGPAKLAAIRAQFGDAFSYAGDSAADLPIWKAARTSVLVGVSRRVGMQAERFGNVEKRFSYAAPSVATWLRAMRVHQWVKNFLMFVPLLTAFAFSSGEQLVSVAIGFIAFSLAASGTYILNDIWDLESDRNHPRKCARPFAACAIPLERGIGMAGLLVAIASMLALAVSVSFLGMLVIYIILTTAYSLKLKRYVLIDVLVLALLYTFRVLAGAVAISVGVSTWLLAFCIFIFFSLALVKRCAELVSLRDAKRDAVDGRDYRVTDLTVLWPMGVGAGLSSVVVFGLYVGSPAAEHMYGNTNGLWMAGIGLIYWIARIWIKTARGEMHDDPIVFTLKDFGSRVAIAAMVAITLIMHFIG